MRLTDICSASVTPQPGRRADATTSLETRTESQHSFLPTIAVLRSPLRSHSGWCPSLHGIPVDHFGNLEGEDNGSVGGRGTYWNPSGPLTVPKGRDVPEWVRSVAEGKRLRGAAAAL
jgi:hypothetical protein